MQRKERGKLIEVVHQRRFEAMVELLEAEHRRKVEAMVELLEAEHRRMVELSRRQITEAIEQAKAADEVALRVLMGLDNKVRTHFNYLH